MRRWHERTMSSHGRTDQLDLAFFPAGCESEDVADVAPGGLIAALSAFDPPPPDDPPAATPHRTSPVPFVPADDDDDDDADSDRFASSNSRSTRSKRSLTFRNSPSKNPFADIMNFISSSSPYVRKCSATFGSFDIGYGSPPTTLPLTRRLWNAALGFVNTTSSYFSDTTDIVCSFFFAGWGWGEEDE